MTLCYSNNGKVKVSVTDIIHSNKFKQQVRIIKSMNHVHPSIVQQKDKELAILEELVNKLMDKIEKLENIVAMYKAQADYIRNEGENK